MFDHGDGDIVLWKRAGVKVAVDSEGSIFEAFYIVGDSGSKSQI